MLSQVTLSGERPLTVRAYTSATYSMVTAAVRRLDSTDPTNFSM